LSCWAYWRFVRPGIRLRSPKFAGALVAGVLMAASAYGQVPLTGDSAAEAQRYFAGEKSASLDCHIETRKPFLDFSFRYEIGYIVRCGLGQFQGKETNLRILLRVTPLDSAPVTLEQSFEIPSAPDELRDRINFKHFRSEIQFSGVYAAGEGTYENEVAVIDARNRAFRKKWRSRTEGWAEGETSPMSLKPLTVESISFPHWQGLTRSGRGLRLTLLLDAAPVSPSSATLRAWDRAFLVGAVSSVLRQLPLASVRLIAFNLDQQREVFRDEEFDGAGMTQLANRLAAVELGTITLATLQRDKGWAELLNRLIREECDRDPPSDAVVFVGPAQRFRTGSDAAELRVASDTAAPFFYFEYVPHPGSEFPDAIERAIKQAHGSVFRLHSPQDLADGLGRMRRALRQVR
jgi:hypothetical protein